MSKGQDGKGGLSGTPAASELLRVMDPGRFLLGLEGKTRGKAAWFLLEAALAGYGRLRLRSGRRRVDEQRRIYGEGRSKCSCRAAGVPEEYAQPDLPARTWSRPEDSKHVVGQAFDVELSAYVEKDFSVIGQIGERCGLRWGGRWGVLDYGHFELQD